MQGVFYNQRGPVTIMDELLVNTYKTVVPNSCFAEIGKMFFKIYHSSNHVSISSLVKGSFISKESTSSELRFPCKRRLIL